MNGTSSFTLTMIATQSYRIEIFNSCRELGGYQMQRHINCTYQNDEPYLINGGLVIDSPCSNINVMDYGWIGTKSEGV